MHCNEAKSVNEDCPVNLACMLLYHDSNKTLMIMRNVLCGLACLGIKVFLSLKQIIYRIDGLTENFCSPQLHDSRQEGQDKAKPDDDKQQIPDEENAIEMTDDIDGALHDMEPGDERDESEEEEEENEPELDKKMGDLDGQDNETLDERIWGDSDDEDEQKVINC